MNTKFNAILLGLVLGFFGISLRAATVTETNTFVVAPPDGNIADFQDPPMVFLQTITNSQIESISGVQVLLRLVGNPADSGFASEMFVSLNKDFNQTAILIDRAGITGMDPVGAYYDGWDVTFSDSASNGDIHAATLPSGILTGEWQPDGRTNSTGTDRPQLLNVFTGLSGNGDWRLAVGDLEFGGTMRLESWSIILTGDTGNHTITEVPDAGNLPHTAQFTTGNGPVDTITGSIANASDVDMYRIHITDPPAFTATVTGFPADSTIWLFDRDGNYLASNDDSDSLLSHIGFDYDNWPTLTNGDYFIAVTGLGNEPRDGSGTPLSVDVGSGYNGTPNGAGPLAAWAHVDDDQEGDYTIALTGASFSTVTPSISIQQPPANELTNGSSTVDFGIASLNASSDKTFTIQDNGEADLTVGSLILTGADASQFSVVTNPASTVYWLGGTTTFTVRFKPTSTGSKSATLHVVNNDASKNPFNITLTGIGTNTPPTLSVPSSPVGAEATGPAGAVVNFSVTASDAEDGALVPNVTPPSGSLFALGTTLVTAIATDNNGASVTNTFNVTVEDTIPPQITVPADITVTATSPAGAVVTFSVTATDIVDSAVSPVAMPASGSTFARGSNNVVVIAVDAHGNNLSASFNVFVLNAAPVPGALSDFAVNPGATISFTATATDADGDELTFTLLNPPANAGIDAAGAFSWRPHVDQAGTTNTVTVVVTDNGAPNRAATNAFTVIVNPLASVVLTSVGFNSTNGHYMFAVDGTTGPDYVIESATEFPLAGPATWTPLTTNATPATPFLLEDATANYDNNRFYRVRLQP